VELRIAGDQADRVSVAADFDRLRTGSAVIEKCEEVRD
jgi:hypothetical protein